MKNKLILLFFISFLLSSCVDKTERVNYRCIAEFETPEGYDSEYEYKLDMTPGDLSAYHITGKSSVNQNRISTGNIKKGSWINVELYNNDSTVINKFTIYENYQKDIDYQGKESIRYTWTTTLSTRGTERLKFSRKVE